MADLTQRSALSLSKEIVPQYVNKTITNLSLQRPIPQELEFSDTFGVYSAGVVWMESSRNESPVKT